MAVNCDVFIRWDARPDQLRALGTALWRWYGVAPGSTSIYQYLDNQTLADLIAGTFPVPGQTPWPVAMGCHLRIRDEVSRDRLATIDRLRHEMPGDAIADVLIDGGSWNLTEQNATLRSMNHGKATRDINANGEKQAHKSQTSSVPCL